ncbi:MAG: hypothetical protein WC759_01650 [Candidatus Micrarchaeia archaeon]|jgi:hypothetical protein
MAGAVAVAKPPISTDRALQASIGLSRQTKSEGPRALFAFRVYGTKTQLIQDRTFFKFFNKHFDIMKRTQTFGETLAKSSFSNWRTEDLPRAVYEFTVKDSENKALFDFEENTDGNRRGLAGAIARELGFEDVPRLMKLRDHVCGILEELQARKAYDAKTEILADRLLMRNIARINYLENAHYWP